LDFKEIPIHPSVHQVSEIVDQTLGRLESLAQSKDISFVTHIPEPDAEVLADADHLQQVMVNLVGNAIKFSPSGGRIWIAAVHDGDGLMRFSVSDEGPGIPGEEQKYVFRKYYRGESVRETVDGAGLGLSISQGIVQAHGGEMWLKSESGMGSTFTFTLPMSQKSDDK
jgi:signal transduction histidine kinase